MTDFFISYTGSDKNWAEWIAWQLEAKGYSCVIQAWDFRPGGNFVLEMQETATACKRTIAVLSPAYMESGFTQPEWAAAFAQDPTGEKGLLLPVRVVDFNPEGLLGPIVYIDLVGKDEEAALDALLAGVNRSRAKPSKPPSFPGVKEPEREAPRFPGGFPDVWNVPHRRNSNFTGREGLLAALEKGLNSGKPAALTQALAGLGGVGKTQTSLEYVYRHAAEYDVVWWIRSEEKTTLAADYAALAQSLKLKERDAQEQEVIVAAVRHWLETHTGWLLVFDNAETQTDIVDYLPRHIAGQIIITSRNQVFGDIAESLSVYKWERDESKAFLAKRTKRDESDGANAIAEALGDLPLALAQAAAYMEATGESYIGYLKLFQERHQEIWAHETKPLNYPATVATTWTLSMEKAEVAAPGATALMSLCAFFAPDDIPREMLCAYRNEVPEPLQTLLGDALKLNNVLASLRRYSLVEVCNNALDMHHLVQVVVQDRLDNVSRKKWCTAALYLVNAAYPNDVTTNPTAWPVCSCLTPHARVVTVHAEILGVAQEAATRLLNQMALYLWDRMELREAHALFSQALKIAKKIFGISHTNIARFENNLGLVLGDLGEFLEAKVQFERALKIEEETRGASQINIAAYANNLGEVLRRLGDLQGARMQFERAKKIDEIECGSNHISVARDLGNLGLVLQDIGRNTMSKPDLEQARIYFEQALTIDERLCDSDHPNIGRDCNNLGGVLVELGDFSKARYYLDRAIKIKEMHYGRLHPKIVQTVNNLAVLQRKIGNLEESKKYLIRALKIVQMAFGQNHPEVARQMNNIGMIYRDNGDLVRARKYFEESLAIEEKVCGQAHPNITLYACNLGEVLLSLNDLSGAKAQFERVLKVEKTNDGINHRNVVIHINNLGSMFYKSGELEEARSCFSQALKIGQFIFGQHHSLIATMATNLATALKDLGDMTEAKNYYEQALAIDEKVFGKKSSEVARDINNVGEMLQGLGNFEEARAHFKRAHTICRQVLGDKHPNTKRVKQNLSLLEK